ncbi:MAG: Unknown protein [uncultured Sulfurovum sp.]|uniref:Uncharacterized protein n=1 Tax=uncultured Sulfurovum sp. TaxID=269237 RepID=A0A6S6U4Y5_9BACT|nr:MAG: Unknown protein [uncultured Sulfurovum sp.]
MKNQWNRVIILFVFISAIGLVDKYYNSGKLLWEYYVDFSVVATVALAILAFMGYVRYIHGEDTIKIYFQKKEKKEKIDTGLIVLRKNCVRSELQGLLGMIHVTGGRYDLKSFQRDGEMLEVINQVQTNKFNEIVIKVSEKELEQFEIL